MSKYLVQYLLNQAWELPPAQHPKPLELLCLHRALSMAGDWALLRYVQAFEYSSEM